MIGQTLRHYKIIDKIGAGGMGVVYRALDTHLDRPVAVKVLSPGALSSADRRRRFVQEAKSASALNHPNIITIYDIDIAEADGQPVNFIAMEFVAGQTLDRLIGKRGLKAKEALRYATQIADALSAAHGSNIVHRDLKPSNVMVNEQGLVKLLDFGLAKLSEPMSTDSQSTDAFATTEFIAGVDAPLTEEGLILGTVAYMSPEQAESRKVDARSDIFSFGSLMYEMLSGRRPFTGESKVATLSAILHLEPPPLGDGGLAVPADFERIIARCLRKEPDRRWQSARDLKIALDDLLEEVESGRALSTATRRAPSAIVARTRRWALPVLAGVALGAVPAAFLGRSIFHSDPPVFQRLTFRHGDIHGARFAPDGSVIYSAEWDGSQNTVYTLQPGNRESRSLGLPEAEVLAISSRGELALRLAKGTLARVSLSGGAPREVLEDVTAADWSSEGTELAVVRRMEGVYRVEFPIGTVLHSNRFRQPEWPKISPKGGQVAFFDYDREAGDYSLIVIGADRKARPLARGFRGVGGLVWSRGGDELWFCGLRTGGDPSVFAVSLSGKERRLVQSTGWLIVQDRNAGGELLVTSVTSRISTRGRMRPTEAEHDLSWHDTSRIADLAADGSAYVFTELSHGDGRNTAIYYRKTDGSSAVQLGDGNKPVLSPDGQWVACIRRDLSDTHLLLMPAGPGEPRTIRHPQFRYENVEWFPDGKRLLVTGSEAGKAVRSYVQGIEGTAPSAITAENDRAFAVSPEGNRVVVARADGTRFVRALTGGTEQLLSGLAKRDVVLRWAISGKALILESRDAAGMQLNTFDVGTGTRKLLRELPLAEPGAVFVGHVAMSSDAESYAYSYQRDVANIFLIRGLR